MTAHRRPFAIRLRPAPIIAALVVLGAGCTGGFALAGFATAGAHQPPPVEWPAPVSDALTEEEKAAVAPATVEAPENYVCKGCGPTLAQRQMDSYAGVSSDVDADYEAAYRATYREAKDYDPLPPYRPVPYDRDVAGDMVGN